MMDSDVQWQGGTNRTVRAWRSTGAPDKTAAGRVSPGSLPSITRLGTIENVLGNKKSAVPLHLALLQGVRCAVVGDCGVVGLVPQHSVGGFLLWDHGELAVLFHCWVRCRRVRAAIGAVCICARLVAWSCG